MAVSPPTIDEQYSSLASPTREFREGPLPAFRARRVSMARSPPGPLVQDEEMGTGGGQSSRSMPRKKSQDVDQNYTRISASIRDSSNRLASLSFKPRASISSLTSGSNEAASISPYSLRFTHHHHSVSSGHSVPVHPLPGPSHLYETLLSPQSSGSGGVAQADGSPRLSRTSPKVPLEPINSEDVSPTQSQSGPSGLSRMMELEKARSAKIHSPIHEGVELPDDTTPRPSRGQSTVQLSAGAASPDQSNSPDDQLAMPTITDSGRKSNRTEMAPAIIVEPSEEEEQHAARTLQRYITKTLGEEDEENNDNSGSSENSPLLRRRSESLAHDKTHEHGSGSGRLGRTRWELNQRVRKMTWKGVLSACVADPLKTLPSVILGMLLNVLDGVSYGMIL
ncbi:hypothetical protein BD324DRAFT_474466 [Kockovaella imperatae]|uniref:Uncharacterized protein n=1 Tax=Kockovaella imperatae TaxID=4999 RepID=A0A1Y1UFM7_9TREE|nr:hypothetical protein BD324DRAFT_474466 [Kockovaella imperatae]ORX36861.1 hypothetical protein BD324DRAFT_474466 [Kockovaella imperatae]